MGAAARYTASWNASGETVARKRWTRAHGSDGASLAVAVSPARASVRLAKTAIEDTGDVPEVLTRRLQDASQSAPSSSTGTGTEFPTGTPGGTQPSQASCELEAPARGARSFTGIGRTWL